MMYQGGERVGWVMSVDNGGLCDRWQHWLEETGCWRSGQLSLTVACCFSTLSLASSSCFCRAVWRDFISSLSSGREGRNTLLADPAHTISGFDHTTTFLLNTTGVSPFAQTLSKVISRHSSKAKNRRCIFDMAQWKVGKLLTGFPSA